MWEELKDYIYKELSIEAENVDITGLEEDDSFEHGKIRAFDLVLRKIKEIEQKYV